MKSLFGHVAVASALLGLALVPAARADVVYGNLGSAGTDALSSSLTDFGPGKVTVGLAQGFSTGPTSDNANLRSVKMGASLGLAATGSAARTVSIFSSTGAAPGQPGTLVATSDPVTVSAGNSATYDFDFGTDLWLQPNTQYWIVPDASVNWSWAFNDALTVPDEQNNSDWLYVSTLRQQSAAPTTWVNSPLAFYATSITAVPEPSTIALAAGALGICGLAAKRRSAREGRVARS